MDAFHQGGLGMGTDAFGKVWSDFMTRMASAGMTQGFAGGSDEPLKQMQKAFLDAWAKSCEDYMRSDAFLESMKQSMDQAMAFRKQIDEWLQGAMRDSHVSTREDADSIMQVLRSLEQNVLDRLDDLSRRVGALEQGESNTPPKKTPARKTAPTKGGTR